MGDVPTLVFRSSHRFLWGRAVLYGGVLGFGGIGLALMKGSGSAVAAAILITIGVTLLLGVLFSLTVWLMPVYVSASGVRSYNGFGVYRTLTWDEMAEVREDGMGGLGYLVISNRSGWREIWVPLFLADMPNVNTAVRACVDADHVLAKALMRVGL
ncbi:hypothetical protein [Limnoglobus roseus]|uniref:PH domain-containing protein n=1 Tax=Limnoglobus roseus TaxID=2598579 RepID=A0A5C1AHP9_9BACT|nr:hypothetical protein [Limnoglobus roseus]QEL17526.1 hypothetical protein PX52LOC_04516 [Limnoglobus roseus]